MRDGINSYHKNYRHNNYLLIVANNYATYIIFSYLWRKLFQVTSLLSGRLLVIYQIIPVLHTQNKINWGPM